MVRSLTREPAKAEVKNTPIPKDPTTQARKNRVALAQRPISGQIPHLGVLGYWGIGVFGYFSVLISERCHLLPHSMQPPFALVVADGAFGDEADAGVGHVVTEDRVVRAHVLAADDSAEDSLLFLTGDERFATAFDDHVSVGEDVGNAHGDAGGDFLGVIDLAAAVEVLRTAKFHGWELAAFGEETAGRGRGEQGLETG